MADVETKFLNERVVVEIRFANEIVDFPFSIRSRPSSGLDHGGSLKNKYVNFKLCFYLKRSEWYDNILHQLSQNMKTDLTQIYTKCSVNWGWIPWGRSNLNNLYLLIELSFIQILITYVNHFSISWQDIFKWINAHMLKNYLCTL